MPDESLLGPTGPHAIHDHVRGLELLVPCHDLAPAMSLVAREERVVLQELHHVLRRQHGEHAAPHIRNGPLRPVPIDVPRAPLRRGHPDASVAEQAALCREAQDVRREHPWDALLVARDVVRPVKPRLAPNGRLQLPDHDWEPIDKQDDVQPLPALVLRVDPLVGYDVLILAEPAILGGTEEPH